MTPPKHIYLPNDESHDAWKYATWHTAPMADDDLHFMEVKPCTTCEGTGRAMIGGREMDCTYFPCRKGWVLK